MKKKFICFILLLTMLFPFASCKDEAAYKRLDELSAKIQALETEKGVLNDKISELEAENQTQAGEIAELEMLQNVYKGTIVNFYDAYKTKRITKEDVVSILYHRNEASLEENKEAVGENFVPKPKFPETLPPFLETFIKSTIVERLNTPHNLNLTVDKVHITGYYGIYYSSSSNFCCIAYSCYIEGRDGTGDGSIRSEGINFPYDIFVWCGECKLI